MATTSSFRFPPPPAVPEFIAYTGPPKSRPSRQRTCKGVEPDTDDWLDIDEVLETVSECDLTSDDAQPLISTAEPAKSQKLLHSGDDEVGRKDDSSILRVQRTHQPSREKRLRTSIDEREAPSTSDPDEGSCREHPVVIADDLTDDEESEDDVPDAECHNREAELQFDESLDIASGQSCRKNGGDKLPSPAQEHVTPDDDGLMDCDDVLGRERSPSDEAHTASRLGWRHRKRKRAQSAGTDTSTISQPAVSITGQCDEGGHSPKRQRSRSSPRHDSASGRPSTLRRASSIPCNVANPQTDGPCDGSARNDDRSYANTPGALGSGERDVGYDKGSGNNDGRAPDDATSTPLETLSGTTFCSGPSQRYREGNETHPVDVLEEPEGDGDGEMDGMQGDAGDGIDLGKTAVVRQLRSSINNPRPKEPTTKGGFRQSGLEGHAGGESEISIAKWTRQRKTSSHAATVQRMKRRKASLVQRKARPKYSSQSSRRMVRSSPSRPTGGFYAHPPQLRPPVAEMTLPLDHGGPLSRHTPQKLARMSLTPVSPGMSVLVTVIQNDRTAPAFCYEESMALIKSSLGDAGHIDAIAIEPQALNSWLLIGYFHAHRHTFGSTATQTTTQAAYASSDSEDESESDSERATYTIRDRATHAGAIPSTSDEQSSEDSDGSSDSDVDPGCGGGRHSRDEDMRASGQGRRSWTESEERRLLEYRKGKLPWKEIFPKFPGRTEGAVRTRWHVLQGSA